MNKLELKRLLEENDIRPDAYSLDGGQLDESLCLEDVYGTWYVYYSERGLRTGERRFSSEDEACQCFLKRILKNPVTRKSFGS